MNFVGGISGGKINVCLPEKEFTAILGKTFGDVKRGEIVAYMGSSGLLEIAKNRGNLALEARVKTGQEIIIW
jgi:S-adenosylmethionine hydrolase